MPYVSGTIRKGETITYQCDKEGCKRVGQVKLVTQRIPPKGIQCRPCAKASGHTVATGYVLLATPAERDAGRKKGRETRSDQAVARRRAEAEAAAKDAPTQDQLDEEYDRLTAQIKRRKWALGMFFIFGIALGGRAAVRLQLRHHEESWSLAHRHGHDCLLLTWARLLDDGHDLLDSASGYM